MAAIEEAAGNVENNLPFARFDLARWPVVLIKLRKQPRDVMDFEGYLTGLNQLYERKEKFSLIIDANDVGWMPPLYIFRQALHMMSKEELTKAYVHRIALLITTPIATQLLKAVFAIRKPSRPTKIFKSFNPAFNWVFANFFNNEHSIRVTQEVYYEAEIKESSNSEGVSRSTSLKKTRRKKRSKK